MVQAASACIHMGHTSPVQGAGTCLGCWHAVPGLSWPRTRRLHTHGIKGQLAPCTLTSCHALAAMQEVNTGKHAWANYFVSAYKVRLALPGPCQPHAGIQGTWHSCMPSRRDSSMQWSHALAACCKVARRCSPSAISHQPSAISHQHAAVLPQGVFEYLEHKGVTVPQPAGLQVGCRATGSLAKHAAPAMHVCLKSSPLALLHAESATCRASCRHVAQHSPPPSSSRMDHPLPLLSATLLPRFWFMAWCPPAPVCPAPPPSCAPPAWLSWPHTA